MTRNKTRLYLGLTLAFSGHASLGFTAAIPPPSLVPPDINSDEFRHEMFEKETAALRRVSHRRSVTRKFTVGHTIHGAFMLPIPEKGLHFTYPDFLDRNIEAEFREHLSNVALEATGEVLVCQCVGVPWRFGMGDHFLIRSATYTWIDRPQSKSTVTNDE